MTEKLPSVLIVNGRTYRDMATEDLSSFRMMGLTVEDISRLRKMFIRRTGLECTSLSIKEAYETERF